MKISICIPQYNRIDYLIENLQRLERQTYEDIEVVISDDCSTDDTESKIKIVSKNYRFPIIYTKNESNLGYDRNYRKAIELSSGEYAFVLGNDDSLNGDDAIQLLVNFLHDHDFPELGFCNMVEGSSDGRIVKRAPGSKILGSGNDIALQYYSCFSFVGGLIYKSAAFRKFNSAKADGSIYAQMYIGIVMIAGGCRLFCLDNPLVVQDIQLKGIPRGSYKDRLARKWKDFKVVDGGLHSVIHVVMKAFLVSGMNNQAFFYRIFRRTYLLTFPYWVMNYRNLKAFPEAWGLFLGMSPLRNKDIFRLNLMNRLRIWCIYLAMSIASLLVPVFILNALYKKLYAYFKR